MKPKLLLLSLFACGYGFSQVNQQCEIILQDTVRYVDGKASAYLGIGVNADNDGGAAGYAGYAQKFEAPDTVSLSGFCFYGVMDSGNSDTALAVMYSVNGAGAPDTIVDSVSVFIPFFGGGYTGAMNDPLIRHCAEFDQPILWEGDYILAVENVKKNSDMYLARTADGDGSAEALSMTYYKDDNDSFTGWYDMFSFGVGWNFDMVYQPLVNYAYSLESSYADTVFCFGDTINVISNAVSLDDSVWYNKFYNPIFASYSGFTAANTYDYGDGAPATSDTFHVYNGSSGNLNLINQTNVQGGGWSSGVSNAILNCIQEVIVNDPSVNLGLDVSGCIGDSAVITAGSGFDSYNWSTGDMDTSIVVNTTGEYFVEVSLAGCIGFDTVNADFSNLSIDLGGDTTLCLNNNIVLDPGSFDSYNWNTGQLTQTIQVGPFVGPSVEEVVVEVENGNCYGTDTIVITVDNCLGLEQLTSKSVNVYPNPAQSNVVIDFYDLDISDASIVIFDALGKEFESHLVLSNKANYSVESLPSGLYSMQIRVGEQIVMKKIKVLK